MSAVRLDPFRRIVGVSWPAPGLAINVFRSTFTVTARADGNWQYGATLGCHGDVTALFSFPSDSIRVTSNGIAISAGTANAATYNPATTFGTGVNEPIIATPAGFTLLTCPGAVSSSFFADLAHTRAEIVRGASVVFDLDVSAWALYTFGSAAYPGPPLPQNRTHSRQAP